LNSNEVPLDSEISIVKSTSLRIGARLVDVDEEITRLEHRLEVLKEESRSLAQLRAQNNAIISPLRRIPPEVLAEIFTRTLPPSQSWSGRSGFSSNDTPWVLTHISRHWRAVAISTSLWSL
ncbi:hypothetical protein B0H16DRAFT_1268479, partial [Mycena metata]